jgi:hypothetical protein
VLIGVGVFSNDLNKKLLLKILLTVFNKKFVIKSLAKIYFNNGSLDLTIINIVHRKFLTF